MMSRFVIVFLLKTKHLLIFWLQSPSVVIFSSFQLLGHVQLSVTQSTAACQASLSIIYFQSLPKLMSIESVMPSNRLILCHLLLRLPSIFPSIGVFSNELALHWILKLRPVSPAVHTSVRNGLPSES